MKHFFVVFVLLLTSNLLGQSPQYFSSGNFNSPNDWDQGDAVAMVSSLGGSFIHTTKSNGSSNRYFRFYSALSDGTKYEPNGSSDIEIILRSGTNLQIAGSGKAYFIVAGNTTDNYIFKTIGSGAPGSSRLVVFKIVGTVQTISSVSNPVNILPGSDQSITATLSGSLNAGQGVYLRYTTDNWGSSSVVSMSGSGTSYTGTIPAAANIENANVKYYVFTSGDGLTIAPADADLFTINYNNNGSSYSYHVGNQVNWANLQSPSTHSMTVGGADFTVYTRVYEPDITNDDVATNDNIQAWIGYSTTNATSTSDFNSGWTWLSATRQADGSCSGCGNNDEFFASFGNALATGTYYYVSRYQYNGGAFQYGGWNADNGFSGLGGFWGVTYNGTPAISGVLTVLAPQEIDIKGNSVSIPSGASNTPVVTDDTLFADTDVASGSVVHTFTIHNLGGATLTLGTASLNNTTDFSITQPASSSVGGGTDTTFTVTFNPASLGNKICMVSIPNNDTDENPYTFNISGKGVSVIDWVNFQWPNGETTIVGDDFMAYGEVIENGVTNDNDPTGDDIYAWIGFSTSNPSSLSSFDSGWTWVPASFNALCTPCTTYAVRDEYMANVGAAITAPGIYYMVSRFQHHSDGPYKYGGRSATGGGVWDGTNNIAAIVTVLDNPCSQLFISEYGHHWISSSYAYLEIYNPTETAVSLDNYRISILYDGAVTPSNYAFTSGTTIAPWGVFVVAEDDGNMQGNQQAAINFSGNDTVYLQWNGGSGTTYTTIDQIGDGTDPGTGWSVAGIANATNEHTLIRKSSVNYPNTNWATTAGTTTENSHWTVMDYNQTKVFSHESECGYYPCAAIETTLLTVDFENATGYTPSVAEFNNTGTYNYFIRSTESALGDAVELTGMSGNIFGVQNTTDDKYITLNDIDIKDYSNLKMSIKIAEDDASDNNQDWDTDSWMHITYTIDSGTERNIMWVESTYSDVNDHEPAFDTDFNGVGNYSFPITSAFQTFTRGFTGQGNTLSIKIAFNGLNEQTEDIAIDDIVITGTKKNTSTWTGNWDITPDVTRKMIIKDNHSTTTDLSACQCSIDANKTLTINDNHTVKINDRILNSGTIVVNNQGSLVQVLETDLNSTSGNYIIHKSSRPYVEYDYNYWASPVFGETASDAFVTNSSVIVAGGASAFSQGSDADRIYELNPTNYNDTNEDTFDDNSDDWVVATNTTMLPGKGYIALGAGADMPFNTNYDTGTFTQSIHFDANKVNNGKLTTSLVNDADTSTTYGDNLVGNPYPSAIDAILLYKAAENNPNGTPVISSTVYLWTHDTQITHNPAGAWAYNFNNSDYAPLNLVTGAGTQAHATGAPAPSRYIASGQGFIVQYNPSATGTLTFKNSMRISGENNHFLKSSNEEPDALWLNMTDETGLFRQIFVGFYPEYSDSFDVADSPKMPYVDLPEFYSLAEGSNEELAIQGLSAFETEKTIPLGVTFTYDGTYQIGIDHITGAFNEGQNIYLEDLQNSVIHNLSNGNYVFTAQTTTDLNDRFKLRFTAGALGTEELAMENVTIYPNPSKNIFNISNKGNEMPRITVFDINGKALFQSEPNNQIDLSNFSHGLYFAKLMYSTGQKTFKLFKE
jgi:hypothetical protein